MSLSLLLPQSPACLVRLIWMVFKIGVRLLYSCCFVGCCLQDLFNIVRNILRVPKQNMEKIPKLFFNLICTMFKKNRKKYKFALLTQLFKHFSLKFTPILVSKRRNDKESMIYAITKPKKFQNNWSFFMAFIKP